MSDKKKKFEQDFLDGKINLRKSSAKDLIEIMKTAFLLGVCSEFKKEILDEFLWKSGGELHFEYFDGNHKPEKIGKIMCTQLEEVYGKNITNPAVLSWRNSTIMEAIEANNLKLVRYLCDQKDFSWTIIKKLTEYKNNPCVEYIKQAGIERYRPFFFGLIKNGSLEKIKVVFNSYKKHYATSHLCFRAVKENRIDVLLFLYEVYPEWLENSCNHCASHPILAYFHQLGYPINPETAMMSVENLICLKYLHENGCEWDARTTLRAKKLGKIESLNYAVENGCPLSN